MTDVTRINLRSRMTVSHPFKGSTASLFKMSSYNVVTVYITKKDESNDDIITVENEDLHGFVFKVSFRPGEFRNTTNVFYMNRHDTIEYFSSIFKSFSHDVDPFDKVQLSTRMHPSIMYDVIDLEDPDVRWKIEDLIYQALRTEVESVRRH